MKKLSSYQVKRGLQYFRKHGVKQFVRRFGGKDRNCGDCISGLV